MAKHTQTIRRQIADKMFSLFDHFLGFAPKGLTQPFQVNVSFLRLLETYKQRTSA